MIYVNSAWNIGTSYRISVYIGVGGPLSGTFRRVVQMDVHVRLDKPGDFYILENNYDQVLVDMRDATAKSLISNSLVSFYIQHAVEFYL